jgi:hypothetical protein
VLVLAIVFEYRAMTGSGPNVYEAFGVPVMVTASPRWFLRSYLAVLALMPASLFAAEGAALHAVSLERPGSASCYWTVGGLVIAGFFVLFPFVLEGVQRTLPFARNEHAFGRKMRVLFLLLALALVSYCAIGLLVIAL